MIVVGVSGKSGHGKDEIAKFLVSEFGFIRVGWADELKTEVADRLRSTIKAITRMDEALGNLPKLPSHLKWEPWKDASEDWWSERIHYVLWVERSPSMRSLLQEYGTEVRRRDQDDYWLDAWERRIERMYGPGALTNPNLRIVVPDVRFPNEAKRVLRHRGRLVRVTRPGYDGIKTSNHVSETALDGWYPWDAKFENDGALDDLRERVARWAGVLWDRARAAS